MRSNVIKLTYVLVVYLAAAGAALASDALNALRECPASGRFSACLAVEFYATPHQGALVSTKQNGTGSILQTVTIIGRLNRGSKTTYALKLLWDDEGIEIAFDADLGPLAYLGRSGQNRPLILTDQGSLQILTAKIDVADDTGLAIGDKTKKRVVTRYIRPYDARFVVTATAAIAVRDRTRDTCISAPRRMPGLLRRMTRQCRAAGPPSEFELVGGNVERAEEDAWRDHELSELIFPYRTGRDVAVYGIPGRPGFVVAPLPSSL